jgi:hypothetical protein
MAYFDVFNGDAYGICALHQLRLAQPLESTLVTGVKRDIALLERVQAQAGDQITVLDIAIDKNRGALARLLAAGARVRYFDHHYPGLIPSHPGLDTHIETHPDKGTSLLVDDFLSGRHRAWAVVGTFGDNFDAAACRCATPLGLSAADLANLRELGVCINYNSYGEQLADLFCPPAELYRRLRPFADHLQFIREEPIFGILSEGYAQDMAQARGTKPSLENDHCRLYILPAQPWARRVSGVFANALALESPALAHALLTRLPAGGFLVSVRAPQSRPIGADQLCRQFDTGGGRKAAAGINHLPDADYDRFVAALATFF